MLVPAHWKVARDLTHFLIWSKNPSTFPTRVTGREKEEENKDRKKVMAVQGGVLGESVGHCEESLGFMLGTANRKLHPWRLPCTHVNVGRP